MKSSTSHSNRPGDVAKTTKGAYRVLSMASAGPEMGIAVVIGLLFGWWLDGKLGTSPWMMMLFCIFGVAAGFKGIFRALREADRIAKENEGAAR